MASFTCGGVNCSAHLYVCGQQSSCEPEAGKLLKCPQCFELGFNSYFCSKKCFSRVWSQHKRLHELWEKINANPTPGHRKGEMRLEGFGRRAKYGGDGAYFGELRDAEGTPRGLLEKLGRGNGIIPAPTIFSGIGEIHVSNDEPKSFDCYAGTWKDGCPVEKTVMLIEGIDSKVARSGATMSGNVYAGSFVGGGATNERLSHFLPHSKGMKIYGSNGDCFIGEWNMGQRKEGSMTSANGGTVFTGKVMGGFMRQGEGHTRKVWRKTGMRKTEFAGLEVPVYEVEQEDVYVGEYDATGRMHGSGEWTWANGDSFKGTFRNNKITAGPFDEGIFFHHATGIREVVRDPARAAELQMSNESQAYLSFDIVNGTSQESRTSVIVPMSGASAGSIVLAKTTEDALRIAEEDARRPAVDAEDEDGWEDTEDQDPGEIVD